MNDKRDPSRPADGASASNDTGPAGEKLHKVLADLGFGARRRMETLIKDGRVTVNGEVAHLGQRVQRSDAIEVDGKPPARARPEPSRVLVLNKSTGVVCSRRDTEGRPTVFQNLPKLRQGRWISVGRLDVMTSGLLLFTNDGALAQRMMHPSTGLDREYAVRVDKVLPDEDVEALMRGVVIDEDSLGFSDLRYYDGSGRNHWYHAVLMEGKNREVRRLFETVGAFVSRLKRVRYGPVALPSWLRVGHLAELHGDDLASLYELLKLTPTPGSRRPLSRRDKGSMLLPYPELPALAELPTPKVVRPGAKRSSGRAEGRGRVRADERAMSNRGSGGKRQSGSARSSAAGRSSAGGRADEGGRRQTGKPAAKRSGHPKGHAKGGVGRGGKPSGKRS